MLVTVLHTKSVTKPAGVPVPWWCFKLNGGLSFKRGATVPVSFGVSWCFQVIFLGVLPVVLSILSGRGAYIFVGVLFL